MFINCSDHYRLLLLQRNYGMFKTLVRRIKGVWQLAFSLGSSGGRQPGAHLYLIWHSQSMLCHSQSWYSVQPKGSNFNSTAESQSVLSPRSADGVGLSMVEYVLASSPGGQELDAQIIKAGFVSLNTTLFVIFILTIEGFGGKGALGFLLVKNAPNFACSFVYVCQTMFCMFFPWSLHRFRDITYAKNPVFVVTSAREHKDGNFTSNPAKLLIFRNM